MIYEPVQCRKAGGLVLMDQRYKEVGGWMQLKTVHVGIIWGRFMSSGRFFAYYTYLKKFSFLQEVPSWVLMLNF